MQTYLARIVFRIVIEDKSSYEEQLRLVQAHTPEQAYDLAGQLGKAEEETLPREESGLVSWVYAGISELTEIAAPQNGALLDSHIREPEDPASFERYMQGKITLVQDRFNRHSLSPVISS